MGIFMSIPHPDSVGKGRKILRFETVFHDSASDCTKLTLGLGIFTGYQCWLCCHSRCCKSSRSGPKLVERATEIRDSINSPTDIKDDISKGCIVMLYTMRFYRYGLLLIIAWPLYIPSGSACRSQPVVTSPVHDDSGRA